MKKIVFMIMMLFIFYPLFSRTKPNTSTTEYFGKAEQGTELRIQVDIGSSHNHPVYAIWLENMQGEFIQTLYISRSIGTSRFKHALREPKAWKEGIIYRPAALPYFSHKRGIVNELGGYAPSARFPTVDAYTGATPKASFVFYIYTQKALKGDYKVLLEVNQPWDWNEYWTNNRYPDNEDYKTSSQPAIVYQAIIDSNHPDSICIFQVMGHSHFSGSDNTLTKDLSTITTALNIIRSASITLLSKYKPY